MSSFPNLSPGTVKTGPVDVLAGLAVGGFGTYMAAKSPTLRWTYKGKDSPWLVLCDHSLGDEPAPAP